MPRTVGRPGPRPPALSTGPTPHGRGLGTPPRFGRMPASAPTILATSMGFASRGRGFYDWRPGPVFDLAFQLAGSPERPNLCYLGTATGDDPVRIAAFY